MSHSLSEPLDFHVRRDGAINVVTVRGAADLDDAESFAQRLLQLIEPASATMILDVSDLTFISSAGIGAMLAAASRAKDLSGSVHLVNPRPTLARLFQLTRLDEIIPTHPTVEAARRAVGGS